MKPSIFWRPSLWPPPGHHGFPFTTSPLEGFRWVPTIHRKLFSYAYSAPVIMNGAPRQGKGQPSVWVLNSAIFFWWDLWKEHWHGLCLSFNIIVGKTNALSQVIERSQIECWNIEEAFLRFVFLASRKQIPPGLHYAWGLCKVTKYIVVANT